MIKPVFASFVFILCCLTGVLIREGMRIKSAETQALLSDLNAMLSKITLERAEFSSLINHLSMHGKLKRLWREMESGAGDGAGIEERAAGAVRTLTVSEANRQELEAYLICFGSGDTETEKRRLEGLIKSVGDRSAAEREELDKRMKLTTALSALVGIALSLMMI